jgi:hypothetical protein
VFPRVPVPVVGLTRRAGHHLDGCGVVEGRVHALAPRVPWRAGQPHLAGSARGGFAFRHAAPQADARGWAWAGLFKDGVGPERVVAVTGAATVGGEVALRPAESALGAMAVRAYEPLRMRVTLQPEEADTIIQQFGEREINHIGVIPHHAR